MCKSMSAKRCLLILLTFGISILSAQISSWMYGSVFHYKTLANEHLTGYDFNNIVTVPIGAYNLESDNRLFYTDRNMKHERYDRMVIKPAFSLSRKWDNGFGKVYYRGEYYDDCTDRVFFSSVNMPYLKHTYNQQAGLSGIYNIGALSAKLIASHNTFYYEPQADGETKIRQVNNLSANAEIGYNVVKPVTMFVAASLKKAADKVTDAYDTETAGIGLKLNLPITYTQYLQGMTRIDWLKGDLYSLDLDTQSWMLKQNTQRLMPITHDMRFSQMITPQIIGFISYENRSFYDKDKGQFLFNSHFIRSSCKYSFPYDLAGASFVEVGAKYAPSNEIEHKSSNYFTKAELKTIGKLYLGAGFNSMPERLVRYEGIARYYISSWNEVFINYIYQDDPEYDNFTTYTSAGVRMMF